MATLTQQYKELSETTCKTLPDLESLENKDATMASLYNPNALVMADYLLDQSIQKNPFNPVLHHDKGNILLGLQRYKEALEQYNFAIQIGPVTGELLASQARAICLMGEGEKALEMINNALVQFPMSVHCHGLKGRILYLLKRDSEALEYVDKALELDFNHFQAIVDKGHILCELQRHEEAIEWQRKALEISPGCAEALASIGFSLRQMGRREEAVEIYNQVIALNPYECESYHVLGQLYAELEKEKEALKMFNQVIKMLKPCKYNPAAFTMLKTILSDKNTLVNKISSIVQSRVLLVQNELNFLSGKNDLKASLQEEFGQIKDEVQTLVRKLARDLQKQKRSEEKSGIGRFFTELFSDSQNEVGFFQDKIDRLIYLLERLRSIGVEVSKMKDQTI